MLNHRLSLEVSESIPSTMARLSILALRLNDVAIASFIDVTNKLYSRKINTNPMTISRRGELNMIFCFKLNYYVMNNMQIVDLYVDHTAINKTTYPLSPNGCMFLIL